MLISHDQLIELMEGGMIANGKEEAVNAASIDIHLGPIILREMPHTTGVPIVDYRLREPIETMPIDITDSEYILKPGEFVLAHSVEVFHLPYDISAEYKLKSSMARIGLEHLNAGWCDAGWYGSVLTLELKNISNYHAIRLRAGDAIGQMVFFQHPPVPQHRSYAARGRYNNDTSVSTIKP
jgi:dCTP deaminase